MQSVRKGVRVGLVLPAVTLSVLLPQVGSAQVQNPSFEDPSPFHYWTAVGDDQIQTSAMGDNPTDGVNQALLATETDGSVNSNVPAGVGVSETALESSLGLGSGSLSSASGSTVLLGSGVSQSVSLIKGETVSFDWDFLTNQTYNDGTSDSIAPSTTRNDFAFFDVVQQGGGSQIFELADTFYGYVNDPSAPGGFKTGFVLTASDNPFLSETTYQHVSWKVSATGVYQLGAGVAHVTFGGAPDDGINSALLLDNFHVAPVPEPAGLTGLGLLSLGLILRRRRHDHGIR